MPTYINKSGNDNTVITVRITGTFAGSGNAVSYYNITNSTGIILYYTPATGLFTCGVQDMGLFQGVTATSQTIDFTITFKGDTSYRELVTDSISQTSWPTKLKCNTGLSNLAFSYVESQKTLVTVNGNSALLTGTPATFTGMYTIGRAGQIGDALNPAGDATLIIQESGSQTFNQSYKYKYSSISRYGYPINHNADINLGRLYVYGNINASSQSGAGVRAILSAGRCSYNVNVDTSGIPVPSGDLNFTGGGTYWDNGVKVSGNWHGNLSPTFEYYGSSRFEAQASVAQATSVSSIYTPAANYNNIGWQFNDPPPTSISVRLVNPEVINNYSQQVETYEGSGVYEDIRNTIVKIVPTLNGSGGVGVYISPKTIVLNSWSAVNCVISGSIIDNVLDNAYVYCDIDPHEPYHDESGTAPSEYRQRHWTKFRYVASGFKIFDENTSLYTTPELPMYLISKAHGEQSQYIWTIPKTGVKDGKTIYDMYKLVTAADYTDDYTGAYQPEHFEVYSEGVVYRNENNCNSLTYGPNLVGRIVFMLEKGKKYQIGGLEGIYATTDENYIQYNIGCDIKDEFQAPLYSGVRNPGDEETEHSYYLNRYIKFDINGRRAIEIPQAGKTASDAYQVDVWDFFTLSHLKGSGGDRLVYPRDDLDEFSFGVQTYTADSDGRFPVSAMFNGQNAYIYWITSYDGERLILTPRFDSISGAQLFRYLRANPVINCTLQYGGSISGIVPKIHGNVIDNSPYSDDENVFQDLPKLIDYYDSRNHGTTSTINVGDNISRELTKVIDGGKYNCSYYIPTGYILVDKNGNILHDIRGKIERGNYGN